MADVISENISILVAIIGIGIPILLFSMNRFRSTAEGTLKGTIKLEGLESNVTDIKDEMNKGFDRLTVMLDKRDAEMRTQFHETNLRIEDLTQKIMLHDYRLRSLETTRVRRSKGITDAEGDNNNNG